MKRVKEIVMQSWSIRCAGDDSPEGREIHIGSALA